MLCAHVADTHFGAGEAHGPRLADGSSARAKDFADTWLKLCHDVVAAGAQLLLHAGDVFHHGKPSPSQLLTFRAGLQMLAKAGIPVLVLLGNHDGGLAGEAAGPAVFSYPVYPGGEEPLERTDLGHLMVGGSRPVATMDPSDAGILFVSEPTLVDLRRVGLNLQVACLPYFRRSWLAAAFPELTRMQANEAASELAMAVLQGLVAGADPAVPVIAALHHNIEGAVFGSNGETVSTSDPVLPLRGLQTLPVAYIACGHIHKYQDLGAVGAPPIVYAGSPETIDFGEEKHPCGWVLVDVCTDPGKASYEFRPVPIRRFVTLDYDFDGEFEQVVIGDPEAVVRRSLQDHNVRDAVVRVRYRAREDQLAQIPDGKLADILRQAGAWHISSIQATVIRPDRVATQGLDETTTTEAAVQAFLTANPLLGEESLARLMPRFQEVYEEATCAR